MKKVLVILFLVAVAFKASSQTSAGNIMIGGTFMIESEKDETPGEDATWSTFTFLPSGAYFLQDNIAVGADILIRTQTNPADTKTFTFSFGPFARYYMFTSNENFAFYGQGGFRLGSTTTKPDGADEVKGSEFEFYISPGFQYFFNEKWSLELQLQGIRYHAEDPDKDADDDKESSFRFGASSFAPSLGFRYVIGG